MTRYLLALMLFGFSICTTSFADDEEPSGFEFLDRLEEKNIEIRRSFDGTVKDAGAPASISYVNADGTSDYYSIDLAVRAAQFGEWDRGMWQGRFIPIFERHKNTEDGSSLDKTSAKLNVEIEKSVWTCEEENEAGRKTKIPFCRTLLIDLGFGLSRDSENDKTTRSISLLATIWAPDNPWPGSFFTTDKNNLQFTWFANAGFEFYESLPIERKEGDQTIVLAPAIDETFAVAKLNFDYRPFSDMLDERLSLVGNLAYYDLLGSSNFLSNSNTNTTLALNYYLDRKQRIAIGINYENGESPARNFLDREITTFGFSFKITPKT